MKVYDEIIMKNEMTRKEEKRKVTKKIVLCDAKCSNITEMLKKIKCMEKQDEKYLSFNYIIESSGKIFKLVPDEEISCFSNSIALDLESISIGLCVKDNNKMFTKKMKESISFLLNYLLKKYNLTKEDVYIEYDIYNTRNLNHFIDNYYIFEEIKRMIKNNDSLLIFFEM